MLDKNGVFISYGNLSEEAISGINPFTLLGKNVRVEGFLLPIWVKEQSYWHLLSIIKESRKLHEDIYVAKSFGFHEVKEAIEYYKKNMTAGKVLLRATLTH